jgi:protein-S-isoprenylcysteine O-methyltransferase Ste14
MNLLSILGYLAMAGGLVILLATQNFFSSSPLIIAFQIAALLLMVWARITFGRRSYHLAANPTGGGLVTSGPYHYIRHPIYTAVCLWALSALVGHWSWLTVLSSVLVFAGALLRIFCEEKLVTARYPEYAQYAATTWRMVPFVF